MTYWFTCLHSKEEIEYYNNIEYYAPLVGDRSTRADTGFLYGSLSILSQIAWLFSAMAFNSDRLKDLRNFAGLPRWYPVGSRRRGVVLPGLG